jgi:hypothetical protein
VEAEFQTVMIRVMAIGLVIGAIATTALVIAFRAFAPERRKGSDVKAVAWIGGTLGFVIVSCILLLILSNVRR